MWSKVCDLIYKWSYMILLAGRYIIHIDHIHIDHKRQKPVLK